MFSVPQSYIAYPSGLVVTTVTREMNGTTFQCYIEIALEPFSSTIGTLTVIAGVDGKLLHMINTKSRIFH